MFNMFSSKVFKPVSWLILTIFLTLSMLPIAYAGTADSASDEHVKIVMYLSSEGFLAPLAQANKQLDSYDIELKLFQPNDLNSTDRLSELRQSFQNADVFLMEMVGLSGIEKIGPMLSECPDRCKVLSTRSSSFPEYPRIDDSRDKQLEPYFTNSGIDNMRRLALLLGTDYGNLTTSERTAPIAIPGRFLYHPDAEGISVNVDGIYTDISNELGKSATETLPGPSINCAYYAAYSELIESTGSLEKFNLVQAAISQAVKDSLDSASTCSTVTTDTTRIYRTIAEIAQRIDDSDADNALQELNDKIQQIVLANAADSSETPAGGNKGKLPESLLVDTIYSAVIDNIPSALLESIIGNVARSIHEGFGMSENSLPASQPGALSSFYKRITTSIALKTDGAGFPGMPPGAFDTLGGYKAWYKESGHLNQDSPWVGITTYDSFLKNDDIEMYAAILNKLELKNMNAILFFSNTASREKAFRNYFLPNGKRQVDLLITAQGFNFIYGKPETTIALFKELNVPVLAPVYSNDLDDWLENPAGISSEQYWQIAYPELDGRIEPILIGGSTRVETDTATGVAITKKVPIADRIDRLVNRSVYWLNLRTKNNSDKNVAIVYYNHHGGKDDIGASYLNSIESTSVILQALRDTGYTIDGNIDSASIEELIQKKGRNVGSWAPGELNDMVKEVVIKVSLDKYLKWYNTIPEELRKNVEKEWGPAPGNIMVHDGELVIPGAKLGNIFLGPQPMRGWGDDPAKIAHSPSLPPTHQYIAFYFWLQKEYKADAVIHLGTHGTLEWLPGRSVGLGQDDWPDVLIGDMPDIYPYIMNNPGEGTQAKRRGYAVTIDHLTPPMIKPQLYGTLTEIQQLVVDYITELGKGDSKKASALWEQIAEITKETGIDTALGIDLSTGESSETAEQIEEYLEELTTELMPYGLHIFGTPPQGEMLDKMTDSIIDYDKESRENSRDGIKEKLLLTSNEMVNILRALKGEYIEPGLGKDPVRVPDALPTGRNIVSFDPRMAPDKAAWKIGKEAADLLLADYYAEKGHYPDTVGVVLWAIETMRTGGESVALILRLIGAEPVWDSSGRVTKVKITPVEELGRPRVNVLVTISGLFRDTFSHTIGVLDDAFRQIAQLDEGSDNNYVRKNYLELRSSLIEKGYSEADADNFAQARIFGEAPGTYGTGVAELVSSTSAWDDTDDLVDTYMSRMSYIYGKTMYGVKAEEVFKEALKSVDLVTQIRDSLYGTLDNDDVAQYLGGLALAVEAFSGKVPPSYIINTRSGKAIVETFAKFVDKELKTRLFNPVWIEGMLKEGYAGSREILKHVENMFLVDATLDAITDSDWQQIAETFIFDDNIRKQLDPFALQSIIAWNLEAARRNMWETDDATLQKLSDVYVETAADYGVVCCHHTCTNLVFNEWVANYTTVDSNILSKFKSIYEKATNKTLNTAINTDSNTNHNSNNSGNSSNNSTNSAINSNTPQQNATKPIEVLGSTTAPQKKDDSSNRNKSTNKSNKQDDYNHIDRSADSKADSKTSGLIKSTTRKKKGNKATSAGTSSNKSGNSSKTQQLNDTKLAKNTSSQAGKNAADNMDDSVNSVKGYEIEVDKSDSDNSGNGSKAVTALAVLAGLGVVGVFGAGYLRYYRTQGE